MKLKKANFLEFPIDPLSNGKEKVSNLIRENLAEIDRLIEINDKNYLNFVAPLSDLHRKMHELTVPISHIHHVQNSEKSKDVYSSILPELSNYDSEISQNLQLYSSLKEISRDNLNIEQLKVLNDLLLDFRLNGAELSDENKSRLKDIDLELSELSNDFYQNSQDDIDKYSLEIFDKNDLIEMPESELNSARSKNTERESWVFNLKMPSYLAYMTYGNNRNLRETLYRTYTTIGEKNSEIIDKILALRDERAKLIGFNNYAELSIADKMANSTNSVLKFLEKLADKSRIRAKDEVAELKKFANLEDLSSFDLAYYSEKYRKENFAIDEEAFRPYFERDLTIKGTFDFLSRLFEIEFIKINNINLWHSDAELYEIYENSELIGRLYLDLESREGKRNGAWMEGWESHRIHENIEYPASAFVVCNFPRATNEQKALWRHDDLHTFLHEMGHALHHILSRVNESPISGTDGVEWDAVEFPSQFLENFSYESQFLQSFAKHYSTNEPLSNEMISRLIRAKNFQSAMKTVRQLEFATFDFKLHMGKFAGNEIQNLLDSIREDLAPIIPPKYNRSQNNFSHIFSGGYSAGYYSYKWAEVLSADLFLEMVDLGIFESGLNLKFRDEVLRKGGSASMSELFFNIFKREPDETKLLRLHGILHSSNNQIN